MKVIFLCKRRPQNRDLIERPYGRFYNIPRLLSSRGHEVHMLLGSHENEPPQKIRKGSFTIYSYRIFPWIFGYYHYAARLVSDIRPDIIIGFSDTWYGVFAEKLARRAHCACLIDAYDNYESYIPYAKPLHWIWRRSLEQCTFLTAAGPELLKKMRGSRSRAAGEIVPMAADDIFRPMNKSDCRKKFGLPVSAKIIGYCGSAVKSRGIQHYIPVIEALRSCYPDIVFLFSGRKNSDLNLPPNALHLGYVEDGAMPSLVNAMDLTVAINLRSAFGDLSYPVKIYESLACGVPVLASRTKATEWIFSDNQDALFDIDYPEVLVDKLIKSINKPKREIPEKKRWSDISITFENCLVSAMNLFNRNPSVLIRSNSEYN